MSGWAFGMVRGAEDRSRAERARRRQAGRYALEIEEALDRGWTETAERIRAERREWLVGGDLDWQEAS